MNRYLAFALDNNGHYARFVDVTGRDDHDAVDRAQSRLGQVPIDIWSNGRLVAHVEPPNAPHSAVRRGDDPGRRTQPHA